MKEIPDNMNTSREECAAFAELVALARFLRSPEGCPWDQKQTSRSFAAYSVEEAQEYVEALDAADNAEAEEEFGDALFTLLASMAGAEAEGRFTLEGALSRAHRKMLRRHEHVFGDDKAQSPEDAMESWERIKAEEKREKETRRQG